MLATGQRRIVVTGAGQSHVWATHAQGTMSLFFGRSVQGGEAQESVDDAGVTRRSPLPGPPPPARSISSCPAVVSEPRPGSGRSVSEAGAPSSSALMLLRSQLGADRMPPQPSAPVPVPVPSNEQQSTGVGAFSGAARGIQIPATDGAEATSPDTDVWSDEKDDVCFEVGSYNPASATMHPLSDREYMRHNSSLEFWTSPRTSDKPTATAMTESSSHNTTTVSPQPNRTSDSDSAAATSATTTRTTVAPWQSTSGLAVRPLGDIGVSDALSRRRSHTGPEPFRQPQLGVATATSGATSAAAPPAAGGTGGTASGSSTTTVLSGQNSFSTSPYTASNGSTPKASSPVVGVLAAGSVNRKNSGSSATLATTLSALSVRETSPSVANSSPFAATATAALVATKRVNDDSSTASVASTDASSLSSDSAMEQRGGAFDSPVRGRPTALEPVAKTLHQPYDEPEREHESEHESENEQGQECMFDFEP